MTYQVIVPKRVQQEIDHLPASARGRVVQALRQLEDEPRPTGCVKLSGHQNEYRVRVGDYRVRYQVMDSSQQVFVLRVQHRKDVYRP